MDRFPHPLARRVSATTGLTLSLLATAVPVLALGDAAKGVIDPCPAPSHCHMPRWVPGDLAAFDELGEAVSMDASHAVVGAAGADAVYVYERQGAYWVQVQRVECPSGPGAEFGYDVDLEGTTLLVGARLDDTAGPDSGAAYLFEMDVTGTFQYAETYLPDAPVPFGKFGTAVEYEGPWLAVGEPGNAGGKVHTFVLLGSTWTHYPALSVPGSQDLGTALALEGTDLLVGDWKDDTQGIDAGAVHYWILSPTSTGFVETIYADDAQPNDRLGWSVDLDGERLVAGAIGVSSKGDDVGAVYVFQRKQLVAAPFVTYEQRDKLEPCEPVLNGYFGWTVAIDGTRAAIAAPKTGGAGQPGGRVYTFTKVGIVGELWDVEAMLVASDGAQSDNFGQGLDLAGQLVVAGAYGVDQAGSQSGAAYLFSLAGVLPNSGPCPTSELATRIPYGSAKPGSLGDPTLWLSKPPIPGQGINVLQLENVLPGTEPVLVWGLIPAAIPFDDGTLLIGDPRVLPFPIVGVLEQVGLGWAIPGDSTLYGVSVYAQAMLIDPGAFGPLQTAQSNGLQLVIGS